MYPVEGILRADGPDEDDLAGGGRGVVVGLEEVADVGELMRDAHTAGEEHDRAIGMQGFETSVGAFDIAPDINDARG